MVMCVSTAALLHGQVAPDVAGFAANQLKSPPQTLPRAHFRPNIYSETEPL
jgi:hypothetical protein